jgi:GWxTD domain-containing protein
MSSVPAGRGWLIWAALGLLLLCPDAAIAGKLSQKHHRWLNQEVVWLISDAERKAFLQLATDQAREQFIQEFWDARNPSRGSGRNPFKDEHYGRLEYANQNFGRDSNTPGWRTDMGRAYILLGPPISRAPFPGRGQTYPMELWFYRNTTGNPSLPSFFHLLFYMPEEIGEYRFYRPFLDGPLKLARGTRFHTNRDVYEFLKSLGGDLARAAFSLVPGDPIDTVDFQPAISSDLIVSKILNYANDAWELDRIRQARQLRAQVRSFLLIPDERPLAMTAAAIADQQGEYWLDLAALIDEETLGRPDGKGNLIVSASYRLLTEAGALVFEDTSEKAYAAYESGRFRPFLLAWRVPVSPGRYRVQMEVIHREASRSWSAERTIAPGQSSISEPLLSLGAGAVAQSDTARPFQYFGAQFVPSAERVFAPAGSLLAVTQLRSMTANDLEIEYLLAHNHDRAQRKTINATAAAAEFRNGLLLQAKTLPLADLGVGEYRLVVSVREKGSPRVIVSSNTGFRISEPRPDPPLFFAGDPRIAAPEVAAYLRRLAASSR